jgi:hypothetical protein
MKVLFIDGPLCGETREILSENPYIVQVRPANVTVVDHLSETEYKPVTYHMHRFIICGRMLMLGSVHLLADDIDEDATFELIVSDKAKEAEATQ